MLGNKRDLPNALDEKQLIEKMNLSAIQDREICCYSISCKEKENIGKRLQTFPRTVLSFLQPVSRNARISPISSLDE